MFADRFRFPQKIRKCSMQLDNEVTFVLLLYLLLYCGTQCVQYKAVER